MPTIWTKAPKNSEAVYKHLTRQASLMRVESYGEIAATIAEAEGRQIAPISLRFPLGFIRDEICRPRGLPWLVALAVNDSTWLPGDSFLPDGVAFGQDEAVLWRGAVLSVFAYPWETVDLEDGP
ncbi:MAG: hypothetical protein H6730_14865 [Deltaproteobacteria bacterium]|nr:hypothetical protein [Deltaproteobacteria bacterium]